MRMPEPALDSLITFMTQHPRLVVLTGAGISLASGIPTYRDEKGVWLRGEPLQHPDFIKHEATRRRYWLRSFVGWPRIHQTQPNQAHQALVELEKLGHVDLLITQNVDNLHQRAGSHHVIDLHGNLTEVICLDCNAISSRAEMQRRLAELNPHLVTIHAEQRPDGDAEVAGNSHDALRVPACTRCGGTLMPDVVFFGGTVPKARVERCLNALQQADALLVIGSSLKVYSGYRFCLRAKEWNKPIALLNPGWTRADELAQLKMAAPAAELLTGLVQHLAAKELL